jgi:hypothetical protein
VITHDEYIKHILWLRKFDVEYARSAAIYYNEQLPWLDINQGLKEAIQMENLQNLSEHIPTDKATPKSL